MEQGVDVSINGADNLDQIDLERVVFTLTAVCSWTSREKPRDTSAVDARRLMRSERTAMMATRGLPPQFSDRYDGESDDWPYASLVEVAGDHDGCPILLLSELAVHTSNISRDARISLLFNSTRDTVSPLTQTRLTVSGIASKTDEPRHRSRFLARHPEASDYAGFTDFNFWHVAPMGVHVIIGFGRIFSIPDKKFLIEPILAAQFSENLGWNHQTHEWGARGCSRLDS